ncbi:MAG: c-type cytochrome [Acidobacteriota bacterium]|nr:c-type cytochrome [Acidobacteriota bacterium]
MRPARVPTLGRRTQAGVLATLLAATLSACGSGAATVSGASVFSAHCAVCHSLSGHSSPQQQGGDLRRLRLPRGELLQYAAEMPLVNGRLTAPELRAVVAYLRAVERR